MRRLSRGGAGCRRDGAVARPFDNAKGDGFTLEAGDTVQVRTPGGGGYGPPAERARQSIERDLSRGYYDREQAARDYRFGEDAA